MDGYKTLKEYYLTIKSNNKFYRLLKFEQGVDKSFYIRWNLELFTSKISYHKKYDSNKKGFRVHQYGCSGDRIIESINYRSKFITDYYNSFVEFHFNKLSDDNKIERSGDKDLIFDIEEDEIDKYKIVLFSDKRKDLLDKDYNNMSIKKIDLVDYYLIVSLFKKLIEK